MPVGPHDGPRPDDEPGPEGRPPSSGDDADRVDDTGGSPDHADPDREVDVDAEWRRIVARLGDVGTVSEDDAAAAEGDAPLPAARRVVRPATTGDPRAWAPDPALEEAEDHFVPPDPGPVLGGDPLLTMAWVAALGVPALVVLAVVVGARLPAVVLQVGAAVFLAGLGVLLWRMPRGDDDAPRGPGAVV